MICIKLKNKKLINLNLVKKQLKRFTNIMGVHTGFFTKHELKFIEAIVMYINENIEAEIDVQQTLDLFGIKYKDSMYYMNKLVKSTDLKCKYLLSNNHQCSRASKENGFCMTHFKLFKEDKIKESRILDTQMMSRFDEVIEKLRKAREIPKLVQCRLIYLHGKDYLYDSYTRTVYDFHTYEKIGRIDKFRQLKLYENEI
tara:strand:- start:378 stop:974 length:597 start_codon:yes stop_codon:yes gene_type:complete